MKNSRKKLKQIISFSLAASMIITSINIIPSHASEEINENHKICDENNLTSTDIESSYKIISKSQKQKDLTLEEAEKDSDNDGLNDGYEQIFGTDSQNPDTDGDGLNDYVEIKLGLNPLSKDTDNNGVSDLLEDTDKDGLNNLNEFKQGTDPGKFDTDGDGLKDGEEVYKYNTSPLLEDTDNDTLNDGDEIKLGLNPLLSSSDGALADSERKIQQILSKDNISIDLLDNNDFIPSLSGSVSGVIDEKVSIENYDKNMLEDSKGILGKAIKINTLDDFEGELNLSYDYKNFIKDNDDDNLNQLKICKYEDDKFVLMNTVKSNEDMTLSCEISNPGVYFILDLEVFLDSLNALPSSMKVYSASSCFSNGEDSTVTNQEESSNENKVLLDDYQYVDVDKSRVEDNNVDSDNDGISDSEELGIKEVRDLSEFKEALLESKGISLDAEEEEESTVEVYSYNSNPTLIDTDYDGIDDSSDSNPKDNTFTGTLKTKQATSTVSYTMDYRNFFKGNTSYNSNISTISSLYSTLAYNKSSFDGLTINQFMEKHGLKDIKSYELKNTYTDSDVSQAYIGHRNVTYNGITKEIIAVVIRGTNGTTTEWESNFDIGSTALKSNFPDWKVASNHKGFDVTATRLLKCLDQYEEAGYLDSSAQKTYWLTGHSRGAALANIMGARLIDDSKEVYAYTFAAPNTTTSNKAANYVGIYNIINKEDLVPQLPMSVWGFNHYGKSYIISIADNYEKEWENLTGIFDYNPDTYGLDDTINKLAAILDNRNDAYVFTCKCHGDDSKDNITIRNYGTSKSSREEAIGKIPSNALQYCAITRYNGTAFWGWDFTVCQKPEYFMQVLAAFMADDINAYRFAVELDIADRYEDAKLAIIKSGIGGIAHPHYPESYYVLSKHVS